MDGYGPGGQEVRQVCVLSGEDSNTCFRMRFNCLMRLKQVVEMFWGVLYDATDGAEVKENSNSTGGVLDLGITSKVMVPY